MSSRELLELIEDMPEESEYKRALDGYPYGVERDWTKAEYRQARLVAEAAIPNGSYDLDDLTGPVEAAVAKMRAEGKYPPAWWSTDVRAAIIKAQAADPTPIAEPELRERVSSLVAKQLHGRG